MVTKDISGVYKQELRVLTEVVKALMTPLALPVLLETVMEKIDAMLESTDFGIVFIWDPADLLFRPQVALGKGFKDRQALNAIVLKEGESITGKVHQDGKPVFLSTQEELSQMQSDMQPANRARMEKALAAVVPKSLIAAPLTTNDRKYGVLILGTMHGSPRFAEQDISFVQTLADLIALAIDRTYFESDAADIRYTAEADRIRAEALATLSHELRTPLAAIKGYATALLLEDISWPPEKQSQFLQLIDEESDNLQTMITDILDSSLIDVGQMTLEIQPVRLERLAADIGEEMQRRTAIHRFVVDFPLNFPLIDADHLRVKQVIRNIVDNAIKYSPSGGLVVIRGEARPIDVVISIADQGVGISPEDLIPLFDKYFRVKSPTGYHVAGTGLGLPVARSIVEAHGGRIWARSKVGEGTTLYFSLPRQDQSDNTQAEHDG
jgi:K+-sensing histidine kinase KdpD